MDLKAVRLALVAVVPLCALVLGLLWMQQSVVPTLSAAPPQSVSVAEAAPWPPAHRNLSRSADRDSGSASIDADDTNVVVVWAEGESARGLNDGTILMAWRRAEDSGWRTLVVPSEGTVGFVHYHPVVALHGPTAHVAWVREDTAGAGKGGTQVRYARCSLSSGVCGRSAGVSPGGQAYARLAPDIAVDSRDVPHVVWVRQEGALIGTVWYNNRVGGAWSDDPEQVSGGSGACAYTQDNPAIAVDDKHVYVTWDENVKRCSGARGTAGIYFRLRGNSVASARSGTPWWPQGEPWGKQLSEAAATSLAAPEQVDGFPTIGAGEDWVYVLWERLAYTETLPIYETVYTYSLAYRVYTGTAPLTDWWPGGASAEQWATLPFTSTSATDTADYYAGLRPALDMVDRTPHVVWHAWTAPGASAEVEMAPLGELPSERLVDNQHPYRISYATYRAGADPRDLEGAHASWVSKTLQVFGSDRILAWPAVAMVPIDGGGAHILHAAIHRRGQFVDVDQSYAWDVVYTNDSAYYTRYFPMLFYQFATSSGLDTSSPLDAVGAR
jgi:hypothetical protein